MQRASEIAEQRGSRARRSASSRLWRASGRAASDGRKRLMACIGVLLTGPLLWFGSFVSQFVSGGWAQATTGLHQPFQYVLTPLKRAYLADNDIALIGYVLWLWVLIVLLWGYFGGAIYRMAATDIAGNASSSSLREDASVVNAFARKHWRTFVGARLAPWLGVFGLLAGIVMIALLARLPGFWGNAGRVVAVLASIPLASFAVVLASLHLATGFLQAPTIACEDSDLFDAVSRPYVYAGAGLPTLFATRAKFGWGALVGILWRLARVVTAVILAWACLRVGAGSEGWDRALAIITSWGSPPDAGRLGVGVWDYVLACAMMLGMTVLVVTWIGDAIVRVICARTGAYLSLRHAVDGVPRNVLHTTAQVTRPLSATEAGHREVKRVESKPLESEDAS